MDDSDATPSLGKLFSILHWQTRIYVEQQLASTNLTWGEFHILMRLCHAGQMSQRDVTEQLHVSKATTSKMIQKLERDGYIQRKQDERDHRTYIVHTTGKAQRLHTRLKNISNRWNDILLNGLTRRQRDAIVTGLNQMIQQALQANEETQHA
ncbi:MAG: MarR family transcriptional regulator [Thermoplasmatota archaeon]